MQAGGVERAATQHGTPGRESAGQRRGIIGDNVVLLSPREQIADILYHVVAGR